MEGKTESGSMCKILVSVLGAALLVLATSVITLVVVQNYHSEKLCGNYRYQKPQLHFAKQTEWDLVDRTDIVEKGVTIVKEYANDRCYVMPIQEEDRKDRVLALVHDPLSEELLEELAGPDAVTLCAGSTTYLLRDPVQLDQSRQKRQAAERRSGLDKPYEERTPRCMDLVLDCGKGDAVGKVQECYTWINGVIIMAQECVSATSFRVYMTKPPGRMLKIAQQQWKICLERRQEGLRC